jgi:hypothetical protein
MNAAWPSIAAADDVPIDTSAVSLPPDVVELQERLALNTHANWARRRRADGWRYGPKRDDEEKTTPMLVPYEQLPESERQYDRDITTEALKALIALGYRITKAEQAEGSLP